MNRRQPLLTSQTSAARSVRLAEVAGGTAAECAAICCCCPCGLLNLLFLAVYKIPAGLCRRALRRRKRQLKKKGQPPPRCRHRPSEDSSSDPQMHPVAATVAENLEEAEAAAAEVQELEKEMWGRFYSAGFWRSPSQREPFNIVLVEQISDMIM